MVTRARSDRAAFIGGSIRDLVFIRDCRRRRVSSYDRSGGNDDRLHLEPGRSAVLADIKGAGCVTHLWLTVACEEVHHLRKLVLRMFWDGEDNPSVEAPVGDFFGMGHAMTKNFWSAPLCMSPEDGKAFNCFFPMPFGNGARIEVTSECDSKAALLYYYVDYEEYEAAQGAGGVGAARGRGAGVAEGGEGGDDDGPVAGMARFHAQWRRQNPCDGIPDTGLTNEQFQFGGSNLTGEGNYVILEAEGRGQYLGCNLNIHNLRVCGAFNWYGEGDDMIFIDGEPFPPSLHGTGTEDYFNCAWCPTQEYSSPYHGVILVGGPNWSGKVTLYRYHIADPIQFAKSIRVSIEHGHNNHRSDDYSSTAYWMQFEPHKPLEPLPPVVARLPRD